MSENLFYFLNVCEKNGSKGLQYTKDSFSSKLFPSLKDNQKPSDFKNPLKIHEEKPKDFQQKLDLKNVDFEKLTRLLKIRFLYSIFDLLPRCWTYKLAKNRFNRNLERPIHIVSPLIHNQPLF